MYIYGLYELFLAYGAIKYGYLMVSDPNGYYGFPYDYPPEWMSKFPWDNWLIPGLIAICVFGCGNLLAASCSFITQPKKSGITGIIMSSILLISLIVQMIYLDVYLASVQFFILGVIQFSYGLHIFNISKSLKNKNSST